VGGDGEEEFRPFSVGSSIEGFPVGFPTSLNSSWAMVGVCVEGRARACVRACVRVRVCVCVCVWVGVWAYVCVCVMKLPLRV
ncbi:MAG: hypothetical protein P4L40_14730, partial [Terracidiphilus sp.]|nr:hypothetical protein [Terracidiphilus sp.]